jgi:hypothetical protein
LLALDGVPFRRAIEVKRKCKSYAAPTALVPFGFHYPAPTGWANLWRTSGAPATLARRLRENLNSLRGAWRTARNGCATWASLWRDL